MNVLLLKASPRGVTAASARLADAFSKGATAAGAEVREIMLKDYNIQHCTGCYSCWTRTPGKCVLNDDMSLLLDMVEWSTVVVIATPLYYFSVPGRMKDFIDRNLPLLEPFLIPKEGRTGHPSRSGKLRKYVLISTAGFPEKTIFSALEGMFELYVANPDTSIIGKIFIGGAEPLHIDTMQNAYYDLYAIVEQAGKEVVQKGRISQETGRQIDIYQEKRLVNAAQFSEIANAYWKAQQPNQKKEEKQYEPQPNTGDSTCSLHAGGMDTLMAGMALSYNSAVNPAFNAVLQFNFDGKGYYLIINKKACRAYIGFHEHPDVTIFSPPAIWEAITEGTLSGTEGLLTGKFHVEGKLQLFMQMDTLFRTTTYQMPEPSNDTASTITTTGRGPLKCSGGTWLSIAFLPWLLLWIGQPLTNSFWIPLGAFTLSIFITLYHTFTNKVTFFEAGTLLFLTLQLVFNMQQVSIFTDNNYFFQYLYLTGLWTASLIRPFSLTGEYIRHSYPKSVWHMPSFTDTNRILTASWALYYCIAALFRYLEIAFRSDIWLQIIPHFLMVLMLIFTAWFQRWYPARILTKA